MAQRPRGACSPSGHVGENDRALAKRRPVRVGACGSLHCLHPQVTRLATRTVRLESPS